MRAQAEMVEHLAEGAMWRCKLCGGRFDALHRAVHHSCQSSERSLSSRSSVEFTAWLRILQPPGSSRLFHFLRLFEFSGSFRLFDISTFRDFLSFRLFAASGNFRLFDFSTFRGQKDDSHPVLRSPPGSRTGGGGGGGRGKKWL